MEVRRSDDAAHATPCREIGRNVAAGEQIGVESDENSGTLVIGFFASRVWKMSKSEPPTAVEPSPRSTAADLPGAPASDTATAAELDDGGASDSTGNSAGRFASRLSADHLQRSVQALEKSLHERRAGNSAAARSGGARLSEASDDLRRHIADVVARWDSGAAVQPAQRARPVLVERLAASKPAAESVPEAQAAAGASQRSETPSIQPGSDRGDAVSAVAVENVEVGDNRTASETRVADSTEDSPSPWTDSSDESCEECVSALELTEVVGNDVESRVDDSDVLELTDIVEEDLAPDERTRPRRPSARSSLLRWRLNR